MWRKKEKESKKKEIMHQAVKLIISTNGDVLGFIGTLHAAHLACNIQERPQKENMA